MQKNMTWLISLLMCGAVLLFFNSCSEDEVDKYVLTLNVEPAGYGTVTGEGEYEPGEVVQITATPNEGYLFTSWRDANNTVVSQDASHSFPMPVRDHVLTAHFIVDEPTYPLTLVASPAEGGTLSGAGDYEAGETVTLSATPATDFNFYQWTNEAGETISTEASFEYTMPAGPQELTAHFDPAVMVDGEGNVYPVVRIGHQLWTAENLRATRYANGDPIPRETGPWSEEIGFYDIPNVNREGYAPELGLGDFTDEQIKEMFGLQYNRFAVNDERGLCPPGWKVPNRYDWDDMIEALIATASISLNEDNIGNALKIDRQVDSPITGAATTEWPRWNADDTHHANNYSGLSVVPAGDRFASNGLTYRPGNWAVFWESRWYTEEGLPVSGTIRNLRAGEGNLQRHSWNGNTGCNIRCIKAEEED